MFRLAMRSSRSIVGLALTENLEHANLDPSQRGLSNYPKTGCNPRKIQDLRAFSDSYLRGNLDQCP